MTTIADQLRAEGKAVGLAEGKAVGLAEGKAQALLTILEARELVIGAGQRAAILGCDDVELLDRWTRRAISANSVADVLE